MRVLALVWLAGCGGSADLTCELLANPSNCWATAANAAATCLASRAAPAKLSADRTTCSWDDGSKVVFDTPLPTDMLALDHLTFDATGAGCAWHFTDTFHNDMLLTVGGKTEESTLRPDHTFELSCDDGSSYTADFNLLFTCAAPAAPPTDGFSIDATTGFTFTLDAVNLSRPLFTCK
jgi:hypothetical protein